MDDEMGDEMGDGRQNRRTGPRSLTLIQYQQQLSPLTRSNETQQIYTQPHPIIAQNTLPPPSRRTIPLPHPSPPDPHPSTQPHTLNARSQPARRQNPRMYIASAARFGTEIQQPGSGMISTAYIVSGIRVADKESVAGIIRNLRYRCFRTREKTEKRDTKARMCS